MKVKLFFIGSLFTLCVNKVLSVNADMFFSNLSSKTIFDGSSKKFEANKTNLSLKTQLCQARFEENKGQVAGSDAANVNYVYRQGQTSVFLLKTGIAYQFNKTNYASDVESNKQFTSIKNKHGKFDLPKIINEETYRMDIILVDANPKAYISRDNESKDYVNYYNCGVLNVRSYDKITYHDIYPNIDWVIYSKDEHIKYDFVIHPGGDPNKIKRFYYLSCG